MSRGFKFGLAAMVFFMGVLPMTAQDSVDADSEEQVEVAPKRKVKNIKKYPTTQVSGKVVDAATGEPLAGVKIQAYNNKLYTAMTDENGVYTIAVPKFVTSISADLEDYNTAVNSLNGRTENVDFAILSSKYSADYNAKTAATKSVKATGFENTTAFTADQEIAARLAGDVRTIQRSANPAQGFAMFINGLNSLNSNAQPLFVVDGVVYDMMYDKEMLHSGYFNNLLQAINMDDVESIEVLKNGTAIYGAKAANGVILINTKRCKSMATRIDVNISGGFELMPKTMKVMGAEDYRSYASNLLGTTEAKILDFKFLTTDPNDYYYNMYHNETDWKKEVYRNAWTQKYGINIQGGDDIAEYTLSVGYSDSKSTLKNNDMQRFNIRFNTDITLNNWFSTKFDASYTNVTRNLRADGVTPNLHMQSMASPSFLALAKSPFLSPYDYATDRTVTDFIADADTYLQEALGNKVSVPNPVGILHYGDAKNKNHTDCTMINLSFAPKWQPTKNFSLTEHFAYTMQSFDEAYFTPVIGMPDYYLSTNMSATTNSKYSLYNKHNSVFSDTRADWTIIPNGNHRLEMFGGIRFMNDTYNSSSLTGDNTSTDKTPNNGGSNRKIYGEDTNWRSLSYYANVDYNYMEKYYVNAQFSMETSSRFGKEVDAGLKLGGVHWGLFPSIQGAWVLTNENWFQPTKGVNMLKLNAGFESVGNDAIDNTASLTYMSAASMLNQEVTSLGLANIGNTKLRWETTNRFNAGLEGNFLDNRLNVKFNYFYSRTNNLVTLGTLAYVAGIKDYYTNEGSLSNQGFDASFTAKVVNRKNFKMEVGASVGHYKNKLISLPQGQESFTTDMYAGTILSKVGSAAGLFYGYKVDDSMPVFATTADANKAGHYIMAANGKDHIAFGAGDANFVDVNPYNTKGEYAPGQIDENDRVVIGDPNPDIYGNIFANMHIGKHWSLGINFKYSLGNDIYNYQRALLERGTMFINQTSHLNGRWMAEGNITDVPRVSYTNTMDNSRFSDRWIEDGSYLKLKNITLSYKLPIQSQYLQGITVWAAANNLFTLSRYLGSDPEVSCGNGVLMQGIDAGYLTSGRSFHLGVKINL